MFIMTFILHVTPSDPPITVILIMIALICAATMQACGGLDHLVKIAEKILRRNPRMIIVLAPVVAYIFTFMCGTGHIVYSLLPVINEIAIETGVRPERPSQPRLFHPSRPLQRARFQQLPWQSLLLWLRPQAMAPSISLPCCLSASLPWLVPWSARLQLSRRQRTGDDPEFASPCCSNT